MGDGELTATGCEFGGRVSLRIDLINHHPIPGPRIRFANCWATLATSKEFPAAARTACDAMHRWLMQERGLDESAAAFVIGMAGGVGISQVVNPSGVTVKVIVDLGKVRIAG
jgi:acetamidase/formamidase